MRMFLEEINIGIGRLSKEDCPFHSEWTSTNLLKARIEQKGYEFFLPDCL